MQRVFVVGTGDAGGIGRYERLLDRALHALAPRVELASVWRSRHPNYLRETAEPSGPAPAREPLVRFAARVGREIRRFDPDLVVFTTVNLARIAFPLRLAGHVRDYVVCIHGIEAWDRLGLPKRTALRRARTVVASASYNVERLVDRQKVARDRIALIPLSLEPHWLEAAGAETGTVAVPGRLLSVARLSTVDSYKGVDTMIRALPELATRAEHVTYRVVGEGDDESRLRGLAAELGVADRVEFVGAVDHAHLLEEYRSCEVFVLPSKGEGFGLVLLEAMAFAKPVVVSAVGGPLDVVVEGTTGRVLRDDAELPDAIAGLLADHRVATRMGREGKARLRREFSFGRYTERWGELLGEQPNWSGEPCAA